MKHPLKVVNTLMMLCTLEIHLSGSSRSLQHNYSHHHKLSASMIWSSSSVHSILRGTGSKRPGVFLIVWRLYSRVLTSHSIVLHWFCQVFIPVSTQRKLWRSLRNNVTMAPSAGKRTVLWFQQLFCRWRAGILSLKLLIKRFLLIEVK